MKPGFVSTFKTLTLTLLLVVLFLPSLAHSAVAITAKYIASISDGLKPGDGAWTAPGVTQYTVPLDSLIGPTGVPQLLPSSQWRYLKVKTIHDGTNIFFRFEWTDSTADMTVADATLFADAVAVEIPFVTPSTVAMGNQREPANILFWRADFGDPLTGLGRPENIVAGGPGTVQESPDSLSLPIFHSQTRTGTGWTVIFQRTLANASANGNMVVLARKMSYRIAFAQWDGANQERNGLKMVTGSWQTLIVQ